VEPVAIHIQPIGVGALLPQIPPGVMKIRFQRLLKVDSSFITPNKNNKL
jgi:hypothetical protein